MKSKNIKLFFNRTYTRGKEDWNGGEEKEESSSKASPEDQGEEAGGGESLEARTLEGREAQSGKRERNSKSVEQAGEETKERGKDNKINRKEAS